MPVRNAFVALAAGALIGSGAIYMLSPKLNPVEQAFVDAFSHAVTSNAKADDPALRNELNHLLQQHRQAIEELPVQVPQAGSFEACSQDFSHLARLRETEARITLFDYQVATQRRMGPPLRSAFEADRHSERLLPHFSVADLCRLAP